MQMIENTRQRSSLVYGGVGWVFPPWRKQTEHSNGFPLRPRCLRGESRNSNRYTKLLELNVSRSKQTPGARANRYNLRSLQEVEVEQEARDPTGVRLRNRGVNQNQGQDDHDDAHRPGHQVEPERVGMLPHQVLPVHQKQNENQNDRQPDSVPHLRINQNLPQRSLRNQDDPSAHHNQERVQGIERRRFLEFIVEARFEAQALANHVRGRERQDR